MMNNLLKTMLKNATVNKTTTTIGIIMFVLLTAINVAGGMGDDFSWPMFLNALSIALIGSQARDGHKSSQDNGVRR